MLQLRLVLGKSGRVESWDVLSYTTWVIKSYSKDNTNL